MRCDVLAATASARAPGRLSDRLCHSRLPGALGLAARETLR